MKWDEKKQSRTIKDDKWEEKIYTEQCKGNIAKDIIKLRLQLHMWDMKKNYKRKNNHRAHYVK